MVGDADMFAEWKAEMQMMSGRIKNVRTELHKVSPKHAPPRVQAARASAEGRAMKMYGTGGARVHAPGGGTRWVSQALQRVLGPLGSQEAARIRYWQQSVQHHRKLAMSVAFVSTAPYSSF